MAECEVPDCAQRAAYVARIVQVACGRDQLAMPLCADHAESSWQQRCDHCGVESQVVAVTVTSLVPPGGTV